MTNGTSKASHPGNLPTDDNASITGQKRDLPQPASAGINEKPRAAANKPGSIPAQKDTADIRGIKSEKSPKLDVPAAAEAKDGLSEVPKQESITPPSTPPASLEEVKPPAAQELDDTTVESLEKRSRIIRLLLLIFSTLVVVGLVFGGIYAYNNWLKTSVVTDGPEISDQISDEEQQPEEESTDRDNDSLPNSWEEEYGLDPDDASDAQKDNDFDGLNNLQEFKYNADPNDSDSDNDGYADGQEVERGYNPAGTGKLEQENEDGSETANAAFLAGDWTGSMQGQKYSFQDVTLQLRSDGKISMGYKIKYNEEIIDNSGVSTFEVQREVGSFKSQIDIQGIADSSQGTYLLGFNGTIGKDSTDISGTWYIIPSSLTAPWMVQDRGTFSFRKT